MNTQKKFRAILSKTVQEIESRYEQQLTVCLDRLRGSQDQSPDSSILYFHNLNYLKKEDILLIFLILMRTTSAELFSSVVTDFEQKVLETRIEEDRKILMLYCLREKKETFRLKGKVVGFRPYRLTRFLSFFEPRLIIGLLKDKYWQRSLRKRLSCKILYPQKPRRGQRIRGYRDHGLLLDESARARRQADRFHGDDFEEGSGLTPAERIEFQKKHLNFKIKWAFNQPWSQLFGEFSKYPPWHWNG